MVAPGASTPSSGSVKLSAAVARMGWGPVAFTADDTLSMVAQGILPEDASIELLNGSLVYRDRFDVKGGQVVAGVQHDYVVTAIGSFAGKLASDHRHLRTQTTLVCAERHAPIPDAMVLRETLAAYRERQPTAADAFCVIEVADSSYERDAGEKLQGYARASIQQYVIINLRNRSAEVYTSPDAAAGTYPPPLIVSQDQTLELRVGDAGETFAVALADVLP